MFRLNGGRISGRIMAPNIEVIDDFTAEGNIRAGSLTILMMRPYCGTDNYNKPGSMSVETMGPSILKSVKKLTVIFQFLEVVLQTSRFRCWLVGGRALILPLVIYSKLLTEAPLYRVYTGPGNGCSR